MEIRKANMKDIDKLFDIRMEFVQLMGGQEYEIPDGFKQDTYNFISLHVKNDTMVAWIAEEDGKIVSAAVVCYYQIIPTVSNTTGNTGYIQNVYTLPEYRGRGLASSLVKEIIQDAKNRGVRRLLLNATDMGKPIYEKIGFQNTVKEMILTIE